MKTFPTRFGFLLILLFAINANGQEDEVGLLVDDLLKVAEVFASPAAEGIAYQSGGGWFTSARAPELWEIDLSLQMNVLFVPGGKSKAAIRNSNYSILEIRGAQSTDIPTAYGGASDVVFHGEVLGREFEFNAIDGVGRDILPHPVLQASVGVPFGTEFSIRFFPRTTIENIKFSTYALGLKHNLNQHFFYPKPTDIQFAALVAFTRYDVNYTFTPVRIEYEFRQGETELLLAMQDIEVGADLWLFQLITSKSFLASNWEIFGAAGLTTSNFDYLAGGGGLALNELNSGLQTLNDDNVVVKVDLGGSFEAGRFLLSSMITVGAFYNVNLGVHYRL